MVWTIEFSRTARKFLEKTDFQARRRIHDFLDTRLRTHDTPRDLGKALKGQFGNLWGYRLGDLRIICELHDDKLVVLVMTIGNRRDIYTN